MEAPPLSRVSYNLLVSLMRRETKRRQWVQQKLKNHAVAEASMEVWNHRTTLQIMISILFVDNFAVSQYLVVGTLLHTPPRG